MKIDKERALKLVNKNSCIIRYINPDLQRDRDIVLAAAKTDGFNAFYYENGVLNDKEIALAAINSRRHMLLHLNHTLKCDADIIECAINKKSTTIDIYNDGFNVRDDRFLRIVKYMPRIVKDRYIDSISIVKKIVKSNGQALSYLSFDNARSYFEVVLTAVENYGIALDDACYELKCDPIIVLTAVKNAGYAILHAGDNLKNDRIMAFSAIKNNCLAVLHIGFHLRVDYEIALFVMANAQEACTGVNDIFLGYLEFILVNNFVRIKNWSKEITCMSEKEFTLRAVKYDNSLLRYASLECKSDRDIISAAKSLEYASDALKCDRFLLKIIGKEKLRRSLRKS